MGNDTCVTLHCAVRIAKRKIPFEFVQYTISHGEKTLRPDRNAIEYRLKSVLGIKGINLVAVTGSGDGKVITSYVENTKAKPPKVNS